MASILRIALGRCSCTDPQPDALGQAVCRTLLARLESLRSMDRPSLERLDSYTESVERIEGRKVRFEVIREPYTNDRFIVVVRAFFHTWSRPSWLSFLGVGRMFAEGFIVEADGETLDASDEVMWDFR